MNSTRPNLKIFLLSDLSPQLPAGIINKAIPSIKDVIIQLSSIAESDKLLPILGSAIFTADTRNVPINDVIATTDNIERFVFLSAINNEYSYDINYISYEYVFKLISFSDMPECNRSFICTF